jgi:4-hydroxy-2-oxoheptanedioate aldolase
MIRPNRLKAMLARGENAVGTFVKTTDPAVVEALGLAGLDFVVLDNEHAALNPETLTNLLRVAELGDMTPIVRVRAKDAGEILHALDSGAMGVQVPHVNTAADARFVVESMKYAPEGKRGFAVSHRAGGFGAIGAAEYVALSNAETLTVCYCETRDAVENLESIVAVPGVDVIFIGPWDLSQSFGVIGQVDHPTVQAAIDRIVAITRATGRAVGIIATDAADARRQFDRGIQYVTLSSDLGLMTALTRQFLRELRRTGNA